MRIQIYILFFLAITILTPYSTYAQEAFVKRSSVIENYKGKPFYIHFVGKGETLNAIAKSYNITVAEISAENPFIDKGLQADMVLRIPKKSLVVIPETPDSEAEAQSQPAAPVAKIEPQSKPDDHPDYFLYQVKKQETLYGISKQFNVSVEDILAANPGFESLKEGMDIKIPKKKAIEKTVPVEVPISKTADPDEIVVKAGETLYSLARIHNTTVDNLIDLNPQLSEGLKAGMILKLRKTEVVTDTKPVVENEPVSVIRPSVPGDCYDAKNGERKYQVALLMPFLLDDASAAIDAPADKNPADFKSFNYFQFYAGFMLAADSLEKYGLKARIQVMDADKVDDTLTIRQALRKPGMDKMDLLIGPMYASSFSIAARFAKKHEIGIINPLSRRESIVNGNPYVIKTQVSGSGIATKLYSFISANYKDANVIAVRNDKKEFSTLTDDFTSQIRKGIAANSFSGTLKEVTYSTGQIAGVTKSFKHGVKNIIIFFSNNKSAVPNFVSLLNPHANSNDIVLFGMDGWSELEIEIEFLVNLNYHQVTSDYIDYESDEVKKFITCFRNKYGAVPLDANHAYLGFDIGWYFLTSLMWYGDNYISCIPGRKGNGLQNDFDFSVNGTGNGMQNNGISIVKIQDYKLVKVD